MPSSAAGKKRGPKPRPRIDPDDPLLGGKYLTFLQGHLDQLRRAYQHPNRVVFYDELVLAYLMAFFHPTVRSLRTLDDLSQVPAMARHLSTERLCRSTLSDANTLFDAQLLEPIIEHLRGRVPQLSQRDPQLAALLQQIVAVDSSLFTVASDVAWALRQRRPNGQGRATVRLNLKLDCASGLPEGVIISGAGASETDAATRMIEPGCIYVQDRGYVNFRYIDQLLHAPADFVLRLKSNIGFTVHKELPLSGQDRAAGVISDRIGRLDGSNDSPAPQALLREVILLDPDRPDHPVRLLTSLLDVEAHVVGVIYRHRWQIELFFRWLKVHAHFEHLISHSNNGVTLGFHVAVIAVLLIYLHTGRQPSKYAYNLLCWAAAGYGTIEQLLPILQRRERERELERQRLARKKAAAAASKKAVL
jgi:Transposase DDE domain